MRMSKTPNNHQSERTTTTAESLRDKIGRALGSQIPERDRQEVSTRVAQVVEKYSSPYPDAGYLREIEAICPGATQQIISASIQGMENNHKSDMREHDNRAAEINLVDKITNRDYWSVTYGRRYGFAAFSFLLLFSGSMFYLGAEYPAYGAFVLASVGVVQQLISGNSKLISVRRTTKIPPPSEL